MENTTKDNINEFKKEAKTFLNNFKEKSAKKNINSYNIIRMILGCCVVLIGIIFLLANLNIININIAIFLSSLIKLWPILLILFGLSMFDKEHMASSMSIILIIFLLILVLFRI